MFSIFKRNKSRTHINLSALKTDMHSHLLPGIDDGSPDADTSVLLKKGLEDLGYENFIATPHIMWDLYKNTPETINGALSNLRTTGPHSNIRFAAEHFLDEHFENALDNNESLLCIEGQKILVEFSFVAPPFELNDLIFRLQIKGYQPILAHPERYTYFSNRKNIFDELKSMGCLFQLNLLSICGYYGKLPQELAQWLIAKNYIDLLGTDLHHERHLDALRSSNSVMTTVQRLLDTGKIQNPSLRF